MSEENIFIEALEIADPEARDAFLDRACSGNPEQRVRLDKLLAEHAKAGSFLGNPAPLLLATDISEPFAAGPTSDFPPARREGTAIGPYKLVEVIGEGGMGTVWLAQQQEPVKRLVALKVIKAGMDSKSVLARFEAERQALALMDHPNIAKVLDGGATSDGRPYFVMELVKGLPITKFCDERKLTPRERLELFVPVCQAVQHAHQKGVIHRDIKPSNVLVALYDGRPVPKVIDFGIAKAAGQSLTEKTLITGLGAVVGTPEYMSPEQAELNQLDIDTRSDVYSLGILLYELLTGSTPLQHKRVKEAALLEVLRLVREEEAPRPSNRLSTTSELPSIAANRGVEPRKLSGLMRGELDWIVMKALEKDRNRRYETANGFAMDVQRYLADESVQACPPSAGYRLRKFTRRYRVPIAIATGFLLLLVAGTVVSTFQAIRIQAEQKNTLAQKLDADRQRIRAAQERDRAVAAEQKALTEASKSEQVAAFMSDMLKGVGPSVALGRDTTMLHEILDQTKQRLDQLKGQPEVEADLRTVLGKVYYDLGDYKNSESMYAAALALRREQLGDKHADVASSLVKLGEAYRKQIRFDDAKRLFTEALTIQRELLPEGDPAIGETLFHLGMMYNLMGKGGEAETYFRDALVIFRQHPHRYRLIEGVLDQLALSLSYQRKYSEAEPFARECVDLHRKRTLSGSPGLAGALHNLGYLLREHGRLTEAEPIFREALEIRRKCLGRYHRDLVTTIMVFSGCLRRQGHLEEAAQLLSEVIALSNEPASPAELQRFARTAYDILARVRESQGRTNEAIAVYRNVIELQPKNGQAYNSLAWFLVTCADASFRDPHEAVNLAKKAIELNPNDWAAINTLGVAQYGAGNYEATIEALERSMKGRNGGDCSDYFFLAMAHWQLGNKDEARRWYDQGVDWMGKNAPTDKLFVRFRDEAAELLVIETKKD